MDWESWRRTGAGAGVSLPMPLRQVLHTRCFCVLWMFGSVILRHAIVVGHGT